MTLLICDLHNTLYDEVREYGGAMRASVDFLRAELAACGAPSEEGELCAQIAAAHAALGSDWHDEVFGLVPALAILPPATRQDARHRRQQTSSRLTQEYAYPETLSALRRAKAGGAQIYLATEATANAAAAAVRALALDDGTLSGIFCWPYDGAGAPLQHTPIFPLPAGMQKPHPLILAHAIQHEGARRRLWPQDTSVDALFALERDSTQDFSALDALLAAQPPAHKQQRWQREMVRRSLNMRLRPQDPWGGSIASVLADAWYIGDSHFKDGWLARQAGMRFVFAEYGKLVPESARAETDSARAMLYAVTGWDPLLLQLTQEAARLPGVMQDIPVAHTCRTSLAEILPLLGGKESL